MHAHRVEKAHSGEAPIGHMQKSLTSEDLSSPALLSVSMLITGWSTRTPSFLPGPRWVPCLEEEVNTIIPGQSPGGPIRKCSGPSLWHPKVHPQGCRNGRLHFFLEEQGSSESEPRLPSLPRPLHMPSWCLLSALPSVFPDPPN